MNWVEEGYAMKNVDPRWLCIGYICSKYILPCGAHGICSRKAFP